MNSIVERASSGSHADLSVAEMGRLLRQKQISATTLTEQALERIERLDPYLNSFTAITRERALRDAVNADECFSKGIDLGPMQGIPYALKDNFDSDGIPTTCHSKLMVSHVPQADSEVARRLRAGGAVLLGKLALHEFALGGPSFDLPFPPARNPWNLDHTPGGSSSGAGAAVAAGLVRVAIGTDTGGSIRGPAAYCGTVGLKPTYGLVSRRGVFPLSYSLDHCGPLAWTVEDAAILMETVAGYDSQDPSSANVPLPDFRKRLNEGVKGLRIGIPRHFYADDPGTMEDVRRGIDHTVERLAKLGAEVEEIKLSRGYDVFNACGRIIMFAEAFAIHERDYQTRPLEFGALTFMRMTLGAFISSADLLQAFRLRRELSAEIDQTLGKFDALITAGALGTAPRFDDVPNGFVPPHWPVQATPFNVTGHPAMAIPIGLSQAGLPLSAQIVGRPFNEGTLLQIGAALENDLGERRRPNLRY